MVITMSIKLSDSVRKLQKEKPAVVNQTDLPANYYDRHVEVKIAELNYLNITMNAIPKQNRDRADKLAELLTQAANENRKDDFLRYLKQWRQCFH